MRPWTEAETKELRLRWVGGETIPSIARAMGRSNGSVSGKLNKIGWPTSPEATRDLTAPSPAMIRLAEFDPIVARALRDRMAA